MVRAGYCSLAPLRAAHHGRSICRQLEGSGVQKSQGLVLAGRSQMYTIVTTLLVRGAGPGLGITMYPVARVLDLCVSYAIKGLQQLDGILGYSVSQLSVV